MSFRFRLGRRALMSARRAFNVVRISTIRARTVLTFECSTKILRSSSSVLSSRFEKRAVRAAIAASNLIRRSSSYSATISALVSSSRALKPSIDNGASAVVLATGFWVVGFFAISAISLTSHGIVTVVLLYRDTNRIATKNDQIYQKNDQKDH